MGANHVSTIYAHWGRRIDGCAFRLLVHMALTALDSDNPPMYWAGRDGMAAALGKDDDAAGRQAVKRALSVLKREGAVKVSAHARKGRSATRWEVVLRPPLGDANRTPITTPTNAAGGGSGTESVPQSGTESDHIGVRNKPHRGTQTDPQRKTRNTTSETEEEISSSTQVSPGAHEGEAAKDDMTPFEALDILDAAAKAGTDVVSLINQAPSHCRTKNHKRMWAARQLTIKESA